MFEGTFLRRDTGQFEFKKQFFTINLNFNEKCPCLIQDKFRNYYSKIKNKGYN